MEDTAKRKSILRKSQLPSLIYRKSFRSSIQVILKDYFVLSQRCEFSCIVFENLFKILVKIFTAIFSHGCLFRQFLQIINQKIFERNCHLLCKIPDFDAKQSKQFD